MNSFVKRAFDAGSIAALADAGITKTANRVLNHLRDSLGIDVRKAQRALEEMEDFHPPTKRPWGGSAAREWDDALHKKIRDVGIEKRRFELGVPDGMDTRRHFFQELDGEEHLSKLKELQSAVDARQIANRKNLIGAGIGAGLLVPGAAAAALSDADEGLLG